MTDMAALTSQSWTSALHGLLVLLMLCLAWLHLHNRGRSGPIAALLFVLFGPVLAVGLLIAWIVAVSPRDPSGDKIYGMPISMFVEVMVVVGVLAALVGAGIHGFMIRDELRAFREFGPPTWFGRLRTGVGPSPALAALGLPPTATLEDVERAYRERVKEAHPDRGGTVEQFKRLQVIYEQAKRQAARHGAATVQDRSAATAKS